MEKSNETVVVIGAGPAGLTAAYELCTRSDKKVIVIEADNQVGGISKTVDFKGNKIDIGGHRFFSKSDWVLQWWQQFLPILTPEDEVITTYHNQHKSIHINKHASPNEPHMLIRPRKSRIYYKKRLFDYPLKLNLRTLTNIGIFKSFRILISIIYSRLFPRKNETSLEDFYVNRFGYELYATFFKDYTQKVWGKDCKEISAEWGYQRVKGLSLRTITKHYFTTLLYPSRQSFGNEKTEQTLTEYFLYPQKGPGQLWESVAAKCLEKGVDIRLNQKVVKLNSIGSKVNTIEVIDSKTEESYNISCEAVVSTMPVKNLVHSMEEAIPDSVFDVASNLKYRDFLIVGLLLDDLRIKTKEGKAIDDNWLYIQDADVQLGRVQLFHNWSPNMVSLVGKCWIGAEYFCEEGDELWLMSESELIELARKELVSIGIVESSATVEGTVVKMPKAYPSYVGSYKDFDVVKRFFNTIENLFLVGRNGTHRYNNQDHSMLTAKEAIDNLLLKKLSKANIWAINTEPVYHEESCDK